MLCVACAMVGTLNASASFQTIDSFNVGRDIFRPFNHEVGSSDTFTRRIRITQRSDGSQAVPPGTGFFWRFDYVPTQAYTLEEVYTEFYNTDGMADHVRFSVNIFDRGAINPVTQLLLDPPADDILITQLQPVTPTDGLTGGAVDTPVALNPNRLYRIEYRLNDVVGTGIWDGMYLDRDWVEFQADQGNTDPIDLVNFTDFTALRSAAFYGYDNGVSRLSGSADMHIFRTTGTPVPEPASVAVMALTAPLLLRRRR